jgi:hypothetical protein
MRVRLRPSRRSVVALAAALGLLVAAPSSAAPAASPERPEYPPSVEGFQHFVQDTLPLLVEGRGWEWKGHRFEGQRVHRIARAAVERLEAPPSRDHGTGLRGWTVSVLHVEVDGRLQRAKVAGNASYAADGAGWRWTEVLLYLGVGDSFDFVSGEIR